MPDYAQKLRSLGCSDKQIELFKDGRSSVRDVFEKLDFHGEIRLQLLVDELDYSRATVRNALDVLHKGYQIVGKRDDPDDARYTLYYIDVPVSDDEGDRDYQHEIGDKIELHEPGSGAICTVVDREPASSLSGGAQYRLEAEYDEEKGKRFWMSANVCCPLQPETDRIGGDRNVE